MTAPLSVFQPEPLGRVCAASAVLADVLQTVRVTRVCYGRMELAAPSGVAVEPQNRTAFVAVVQGNARLETDDVTLLGPGDLCVFPRGTDDVARLLASGPAPTCTVVGGVLDLEGSEENPVLRILPQRVVVRGERGRAAPCLEPLLAFMEHEHDRERPGAEAVLRLLSTALFVQVARTHLTENAETDVGWLRALGERHIASALGLIHQSPERPWTVATLAREVGMSRSAFADRFTTLVGEPPLHYLTRRRMRAAAGLLRDGAAVAEVAERVGYGSEAAFSKAFKRSVGEAPGAYRRAARTALHV